MLSLYILYLGEYYDLCVVGLFKIGWFFFCNIILKNGYVSKVYCSLNIFSKDDYGLRLVY